MQKHLGETFPGLIVSVQNYGFFVQVDPILAEGLVRVSTLKNDWYEYRSRQQALVGRKSRRQFRLGDRVEVQIKNVDYYRQQIDLAVIGEGRPYEEEE
nr:S1 RNA-binding domain-containing protein [Synechococcus sp. 65AY6A5]